MVDEKEVAVIGLGPGGVAASIYLKRYGMTPIAFERENVGGKTNKTDRIENYPGFVNGKGPELAMALEDQLSAFQIKVNYKEVKKVALNEDGTFKVFYGKEEKDFKYVILANGVAEKPFDVPGQEKFHKRGFSGCAICDGPFYKGKDVAVIGGGNSAFQEAIYLASICSHVSVVAHHSNLKVMKGVLDKFNALDNVTLYAPYDTVECDGETSLSSLTIENNETKERVTLSVSGCFVYIGDAPQTQFVDIEGVKDGKSFFVTNELMQTPVKNLYAIGDCRNTALRQVTMAVADGSLAATMIHKDYQSR